MSVFADIRRFALPLVVALAITAIAVPTCQMVGCSMEMNAMGAMPFVPFNGPHLSATCDGQWVVSSTPASTLPSSADTLLLTLMVAIAAVVVLLAPQLTSRPVLVRVSNPPPPPEDPLGERFRV